MQTQPCAQPVQQYGRAMEEPLETTFRAKPTLRGVRVHLRPVGPEDGDAMFADLADGEAQRLTGTQETFTREQIEQWVATRQQQPDRLDFAIVDATTGKWCGEAVINEWDPANRSCNYRIALSAHARNRGIGTEVTQLVVDHVFSQHPVHRLELEVYAFNPRAIAVYEKVGFVREGQRRDALRWGDDWVDAITMAILRPDWEQRQHQRHD